MAESDRAQRELGRGVAGPGRRIDVAGVVALTDPGPAAAGVVVTDEQGRMLANRSHYLGPASLKDAAAEALLGAARLAREGGLEAPILRIDDPDLVQTLQSRRRRRSGAGPAAGPPRGAGAAPRPPPGGHQRRRQPGPPRGPHPPGGLAPRAHPAGRGAGGSPPGRRALRGAVRIRAGEGLPRHPARRAVDLRRRRPGGRGRRSGGLRVRRLPLPQHPLQAPLRRRPGDGELRPPLPPRAQRRRRGQRKRARASGRYPADAPAGAAGQAPGSSTACTGPVQPNVRSTLAHCSGWRGCR